jgi:hypothetical protein
MKYKFVLAQINDVTSVVQWGWLVNNTESLMEFMKLKDKKHVKGYLRAKKADMNKQHPSDMLSSGIHWLFRINPPKKERPTVVDDLLHMHDEFMTPVIKVFKEYGELLAWNNLFSFAPTGGYKYLRIITKSILIFPEITYTEKDIRIIQWKGGTHWYAKIGNIDVEINGESKWSTWKEANNNAKKYLKKGS